MIDLKTLCRIKLIHSDFSAVLSQRFCSGKTRGPSLMIDIPKRIDRGPTDILRALAKTVQTDPTAQHYKIPDDPYFKANSHMGLRLQALSIESGRKSARWIVKNNPEFFKEKISEPFIKDFAPKEEYNENSEVAESTLVSVIEENNVEDALIIYKLLTDKNIAVSNSVKQKLLELVCFYNCGEVQYNLNDVETKWFQTNREEVRLKTWKDGNFAEDLFATMDKDCPMAYSALIQGMLKHGQIDRAMELKNAATDKNLTLSIGVYNGILEKVSNIKESRRWDYILEILEEMKLKKIKPNLYTLNAILHSLHGMPEMRMAASISARLVAEFVKVDVKPSLGTYSYLINMRCWQKNLVRKERLEYLKKILQMVNKMGSLEARHPSDFKFFPIAMRICAVVFKSPEYAHAVHKILTKEDNSKFLTSNMDTQDYYTDYLTVCFLMEPIECAMELFKTLTPSILYPENKLYETILGVIGENEAFEHLIPIWERLNIEGDSKKTRIVPRVLNLVTRVKEEESTELASVFVAAANYISKNWMENNPKFRPNEETVSNAIVAQLRFGNETEAVRMASTVLEGRDNYVLTPWALNLFFQTCMSKNSHSLAKMCVKHAEETNHPNLVEMARSALESLPGLDELEKKWLTELTKKNVQTSEGIRKT